MLRKYGLHAIEREQYTSRHVVIVVKVSRRLKHELVLIIVLLTKVVRDLASQSSAELLVAVLLDLVSEEH